MKKTKNEMREWWGRVVRVLVVGVMLFSAGVQAGYKPMDISDITGEQRKELEKAAKIIASFPAIARDAFLCEQLGLYFQNDGSQAMGDDGSHARAARNKEVQAYHFAHNACFVTRGGKIVRKGEARAYIPKPKQGEWGEAYFLVRFHTDPALSFFRKNVEKLILNTAKYLLKTMPKEQRWMILASMGNMLYNDMGAFDLGRVDWVMDSGLIAKTPRDEGSGYVFLDPEGKEHDIRKLLQGQTVNLWRWRQVVWRCENLVGAKDILALFPEEVKAMRGHFKESEARLKDEAKAKNDALLVAADEGMSSLSKERRLARIALAIGLYYLDHKEAGFTDGHLNPKTTIILPDGSKHSGQEFLGETPGLLQRVPHEAVLEFYRQPIEQMAREVAKERFGEMPFILRDLWRAILSRKLIKLDGSPAETKESISTVQTFDRTWPVPIDAPVDPEHTYFRNSGGQLFPYSIHAMYVLEYLQTLRLANLCARIVSREETVKLIPSGGEDALTPEQQRAWLAEKMGFCFTEDGEAAYQSERTANRNAVYVDAQGKVRKLSEVKLSEVSGKWTETTKTALAVGYDEFMAPYKEEIKQLAVQTSKHILTSMSPGSRQSWLAERNKFFFIPNAQVLYVGEETTQEGEIKYYRRDTTSKNDYARSLYYDPSGKIVPTTAVEDGRWRYWWLLYYCESVVGIDAINALFPAEVESMRAAFRKSPFYKK